MKKWAAGLLAAILAPLVVALVMKLMSRPPPPTPDVAILAASLDFPRGPVAGRAGRLSVDVTNQGTRLVARCRVSWRPGADLQEVRSSEFGLVPGDRRDVSALEAVYPRAGTFRSLILVACQTPPISTSAESEEITVTRPAPPPAPSPTRSGAPRPTPTPTPTSTPAPSPSPSRTIVKFLKPTPLPTAAPRP